jgi:zinc protease
VTHRHVFPNGFTLLVHVDRAAPVAALVTRVRAGYFDEPDDRVGIAHVLEHMYFKGTPTRGPGDIANATKAAGGWLNAHTIYDATTYLTVVPDTSWREALDIQFDAWANSAIDADELRRELEVIIQEAARKADTPSAVTTETLFELLHDAHRMRRWRIGREAQLRGFTREMVHGFYRNWYTPSTSILAVCGNLSVDEVVSAVGETYGRVPARDPLPDEGPLEPHWRAPRYRALTGDVTKSHVALGWRTVGPLHPDCAALDLAASVLSTGRASRLQRQVRDRGLASSVSAWHYTPTQCGVFVLSATGADDSLDTLVSAMHGQLHALAHGDAAPHELDRARTMLRASRLRALESAEGRASELVAWEALGGATVADAYWAALDAVTSADIARVLQAWCPSDAAALVTYRPEGSPPLIADATALVSLLHGSNVAVPQSDAAVSALGNASLPAHAAADSAPTWHSATSGVHSYTTSRGVPLLAQQRVGAEIVYVGFHVAGGASQESASELGWTTLVSRALVKGPTGRAGAPFAEALESLGAVLSASVSKELVGWTLSVPRAALADAVALFAEAIQSPAFDASDVATERAHAATELRARADDMVRHPVALARRLLFAEHPYAIDAAGTVDAIERATPESLRAWHASQLLGGQALLSVVGGDRPDVLASTVAEPFAALTPAPARATVMQPPSPPPAPREIVDARAKLQSAIALVFPGPARASDDRAAMALLSGVASGLGGRFFESLRSRQSLAYSVSMSASTLRDAGMVLAYIACAPEREMEARAGLLREFAALAEGAITADELDRARRYAIGMESLRQESSAALLADMVDAALLGRGLEELASWIPALQAVTREDLQRVARTWCNPDRRCEAIIRGSRLNVP